MHRTPLHPSLPDSPVCAQVLPHHNSLDVILAYRAGEEAILRRLRRTLTELGVSTADGTQVPPGQVTNGAHSECTMGWMLAAYACT